MKQLSFVIILVIVTLSAGCVKATPVTPPESHTGNNTHIPMATNVTQGLPPGSVAPDFQLQSLDGKTVSLNALCGKPVVLNFWATWCPFCQAERPTIQQIYDEWQTKGVTIFTLDLLNTTTTETADNLASFMTTNNYSFPVLLDNNYTTAKIYKVKSTPVSFFIDKNGVIQEVLVGVTSKATFDASLNQLLLK